MSRKKCERLKVDIVMRRRFLRVGCNLKQVLNETTLLIVYRLSLAYSHQTCLFQSPPPLQAPLTLGIKTPVVIASTHTDSYIQIPVHRPTHTRTYLTPYSNKHLQSFLSSQPRSLYPPPLGCYRGDARTSCGTLGVVGYGATA